MRDRLPAATRKHIAPPRGSVHAPHSSSTVQLPEPIHGHGLRHQSTMSTPTGTIAVVEDLPSFMEIADSMQVREYMPLGALRSLFINPLATVLRSIMPFTSQAPSYP